MNSVENRYKIIHLMFMRLVLVYLQTLVVTIFGLNNLDRQLVKDIEDETLLLKIDISRLAEELDESP